MAGTLNAQIMIRPAYADDDRALYRLAAMDSAQHTPAGRLLVAEVDGELRAALSLEDGTAIADPFFPTVELFALLAAHARAATPQPRLRKRRALQLRPSWARG